LDDSNVEGSKEEHMIKHHYIYKKHAEALERLGSNKLLRLTMVHSVKIGKGLAKSIILPSDSNELRKRLDISIRSYMAANKKLNNIEDYEIGLIDLETYYSFPNVTLDNNKFKYFNGATNKTITIPVGSYEITALNAAIQLGMQTNGDWDSANNAYYINIYPN